MWCFVVGRLDDSQLASCWCVGDSDAGGGAGLDAVKGFGVDGPVVGPGVVEDRDGVGSRVGGGSGLVAQASVSCPVQGRRPSLGDVVVGAGSQFAGEAEACGLDVAAVGDPSGGGDV